jgi:hypothetical protein
MNLKISHSRLLSVKPVNNVIDVLQDFKKCSAQQKLIGKIFS